MLAPITLTTPRLFLRPLRDEDAPALFAIWSDAQAMRYFSFPVMQYPEQAAERVARAVRRAGGGEDLVCAIGLRTTGEVIGDCALFQTHAPSRRAEIGFCLQRAQWRRGYMIEAARTLIAHAFDTGRLRRIEADVDPRNVASTRLLERLGFTREGLLRERWRVNGEASDSALYGLLASDRRA